MKINRIIIIILLFSVQTRAQQWEVDKTLFEDKSHCLGFGLSNMFLNVDNCIGQMQGWMMFDKVELGIGYGYSKSNNEVIRQESYVDNIGLHHYISEKKYCGGGVSQYVGWAFKRWITAGIVLNLFYGERNSYYESKYVDYDVSYTTSNETLPKPLFGAGAYVKLNCPLSKNWDLFMFGQATTNGNIGMAGGINYWICL